MNSFSLTYKYIILNLILLTSSCVFSSKTGEPKKDSIIWSTKLFDNKSSSDAKNMIELESGALIIVGQVFHITDSIDQPSALVKVSPEGNLLLVKHIGKTGQYKPAFNINSNNIYYEERLIDIVKTADNQILAFGYKKVDDPNFTENNKSILWIVKLDENLTILKDTVYENINITDIGAHFHFTNLDGWCIIHRNYFELQNKSKYRLTLNKFDNKLNCYETIEIVDKNKNYLSPLWLYNVSKFNEVLLITYIGDTTKLDIDENNLDEVTGYTFEYNETNGKVKLLSKHDQSVYPISIQFNGEQYAALYNYEKRANNKKVADYSFLVGYDAMFKEIWRAIPDLGGGHAPSKNSSITFKNNTWVILGTCYKSKLYQFYKLTYNMEGKLLDEEWSNIYADGGFVKEISLAKGGYCRLFQDNGWKIEKVEIF